MFLKKTWSYFKASGTKYNQITLSNIDTGLLLSNEQNPKEALVEGPKSKEASERQQHKQRPQDPLKTPECVPTTVVQVPPSGPPGLLQDSQP